MCSSLGCNGPKFTGLSFHSASEHGSANSSLHCPLDEVVESQGFICLCSALLLLLFV